MAQIFHREFGKGTPVILLHGFPMSSEVWTPFAEKLSSQHRVYTPDLPGFGKSESISPPFSISQVADVVIGWIKSQGISKCVLIGHSLGGYVTLAMAEKSPSMFTGIGLFHSTAYADNEEKKESRNKVLDFIDKNGVQTFTSNFIAPLFADQKHPAIQRVRSIAVKASQDVVKGYTLAMRDRPEKTSVLKNYSLPILFIGGEKDAGISAQSIREQASVCKQAVVNILPDVAHMGMIEDEPATLKIISAFIEKSSVTR